MDKHIPARCILSDSKLNDFPVFKDVREATFVKDIDVEIPEISSSQKDGLRVAFAFNDIKHLYSPSGRSPMSSLYSSSVSFPAA
jgi:hypothetical protein